jgi:hypothetical protein
VTVEQPVFSANVVLKAERLLGKVNEDGTKAMLQDLEFPNIWWVTPSAGSAAKRYRVSSDWSETTQTLTWVTCTCPHGANTGGGTSRCYHAAAALMLLRDAKLAAEHEVVTDDTPHGDDGRLCTCGWPTEADRSMHTPKWRPRFAEHLLDERRNLAS